MRAHARAAGFQGGVDKAVLVVQVLAAEGEQLVELAEGLLQVPGSATSTRLRRIRVSTMKCRALVDGGVKVVARGNNGGHGAPYRLCVEEPSVFRSRADRASARRPIGGLSRSHAALALRCCAAGASAAAWWQARRSPERPRFTLDTTGLDQPLMTSAMAAATAGRFFRSARPRRCGPSPRRKRRSHCAGAAFGRRSGPRS